LDAAGIEPDALLAGWESNPTFLTVMFRLHISLPQGKDVRTTAPN